MLDCQENINRFVFVPPRVSFKSYKQRIPHVMDVTVHQSSFGTNIAQLSTSSFSEMHSRTKLIAFWLLICNELRSENNF